MSTTANQSVANLSPCVLNQRTGSDAHLVLLLCSCDLLISPVRNSEVSLLDVGLHPERRLQNHGFPPCVVHAVDDFRGMALVCQIRLHGNDDLLTFHQESSYMGCLPFDDEIVCRQMTKLLEAHCNRRVAEIGSLDVSDTF
jgi:hypothetical protein